MTSTCIENALIERLMCAFQSFSNIRSVTNSPTAAYDVLLVLGCVNIKPLVHHYLCSIKSTVFVIYLITDFIAHHVYLPSSTHLGNGSSIIIYTIMAYNFLIILPNIHYKCTIDIVYEMHT